MNTEFAEASSNILEDAADLYSAIDSLHDASGDDDYVKHYLEYVGSGASATAITLAYRRL